MTSFALPSLPRRRIPAVRFILGLRLLMLGAVLATGPASAQQVPVKEHVLPNGMRMLMVERHDDPSIAGGWVAHVGSSNERPGITGIAHLFEHMMFKGTPTLGTKDYAKDVEIIAEQEKIRDEMRAEEARMRAAWRRGEIKDLGKPESRSDRYKDLEKQFKTLIDKQREILVKNEFDRVYTSGGASGMNAFTTHDLTAYHITVPANKLQLWMWMESERLLRPVFREFYAERDVVYEERRMRTESTPLGKFEESFEAMFWEAHPYHWPVIGWPSDIPSISKAEADLFYATYYAPQNITLILVGDFKAPEAIELATLYFGRIPRGAHAVPDVVTLETTQNAEKRMNAEAETNPQVDVLWHTVPFGHADSYPLQVLAQVLSGRTGRLYKGLVLGAKVATEVTAQTDRRKWAGLFNIGGEVREGHTPQELETGIEAELARLKSEDVPEAELQKVKNNFAANEYRKLSSNFPILMQLLYMDGLGNWKEINEAGAKYQAVTVTDLRRVANTYFTKENRTTAVYTRKGGPAATDPETDTLSSEQKNALKQMTTAIKGITDPGKLKEQLRRIEQATSKAPAEQQPLLKLFKQRIEERLSELEPK